MSTRHAHARAPTVLVVEEDGQALDVAVGTLGRDGFRVFGASSQADAATFIELLTISEWSARALDLVLGDAAVAGHLAEKIRRIGWPISVVLTSAHPDPGVEALARTLDARLLTKPLHPELLRQAVLATMAARLTLA